MNEVKKQLQWLPITDKNLKLTSETMLQCYENSQKIALMLSKYASSKTSEKLQADLEKAKPDPEFVELAKHIEDKYNCSGLCHKPLFYFTQSVRKGPPLDACLEPLINDLSGSLENLGAAIIITGILFFLMIFLSIPICCFNKVQHSTEVDEEMAKQIEEMERQKEIELQNQMMNQPVPDKGTEHVVTHQMA